VFCMAQIFGRTFPMFGHIGGAHKEGEEGLHNPSVGHMNFLAIGGVLGAQLQYAVEVQLKPNFNFDGTGFSRRHSGEGIFSYFFAFIGQAVPLEESQSQFGLVVEAGGCDDFFCFGQGSRARNDDME